MGQCRGLSVYTVIFAFCLMGFGAFAEKDSGTHSEKGSTPVEGERPLQAGEGLQFPCRVDPGAKVPQVQIIPINETSPVEPYFQQGKKSEIVLGVEDNPFGTREDGEIHGVGDLYYFAAIQVMGVHMASSSIAREMDAIGKLSPEQLENPLVEKQAKLRLRQLRGQMGFYASELSRILISNPELASLGKVATKGETQEGVLTAIRLLTEQQTEEAEPVKAEDFGLAIKAIGRALAKSPEMEKRVDPELAKSFESLLENPQDSVADEVFGRIYTLRNEQIAKNVMRMFCRAQEKGKNLVVLVSENTLHPKDGIQNNLKPVFSRENLKLEIQPLLEAPLPEVEIFDPSLSEEQWKTLTEEQEKVIPSQGVPARKKSRAAKQKREDRAVDDLIRKFNQK